MDGPRCPLFVGAFCAELEIFESGGVKDRRRIVRSLIERVRARWNVSVMDLGPDGSRREIVLAASAAGSTVSMVTERFDSVLSFLQREEEHGEFTVNHHWREVLGYDDYSHAATQQTDTEGDLPHPEPQDQERDGQTGHHNGCGLLQGP